MTTGKDLTLVSTVPAAIHVPLATEDVDAGTVEIPFQALGNFCKALQDGKITIKSGVTLTCDNGGSILGDTTAALVWNGAAEFHGTGPTATTIDDADVIGVDNLTVNKGLVVTGSGTVAQYTSGTMLQVDGRTRERSRVTLADLATVTISTTQGREWVLPNAPLTGSPNVIKLQTTTAPVPLAQERITLIVSDMFSALTGGTKYSIQREDGTVICTFDFIGAGFHASISAQFILDGAVWRLSLNSGVGNNSGIFFGVIPGAGA